MGPESYVFGFLAGTLSILSPCILPLLPIVLGAAASRHRYGPLALAAGLTVSFTAVGLFVATIGFAIGLDGEIIRQGGGVLLAAVGLVLLVPVFSARLATAAGPASNWIESRLGGVGDGDGLVPQFAMGLVLGAVWSPCVGPTLGAASLLAAQGQSLGQVGLVMLLFGLGAALPLAIIGLASREVLMKWRTRMLAAGSMGKMLLGGFLLLVGLLVATGMDKVLEAWLVELSPEWLTRLTTSL
ncbi:cytochrome C biogenesis protein CcdA [Glycocaulis albus]|uniref:Cytochrome C biogenesis protein CcdA n=1 Tax=Glycocaulis albus TaxID=1382801 RepID=A0ABQ1XQ34_9PROT|nr:cytochrome c biogenesis CcdA family protein [Glycocaulis albus]GGG99865.1 cytochrome C biogenesis protein CcdA [Glycocaulis albus]